MTDTTKGALAIAIRHRRHVELSPGVGKEVQDYALAVCDDIINDLSAVSEIEPVELYDGMEVFVEASKNNPDIKPAHVADILDAVVRLIRRNRIALSQGREATNAAPQVQRGPESAQGIAGSLLAAKRDLASDEAGSDATRQPAAAAPHCRHHDTFDPDCIDCSDAKDQAAAPSPDPTPNTHATIVAWLREVGRRWYDIKCYDQAGKAFQAADALDQQSERPGR